MQPLILQGSQDMDISPTYSPEIEVFELYFSKLEESIAHPELLANELYLQDVISKGVHNNTKMGPSARYRATKLVTAVGDKILVNPAVLHKFLSIVRGDPSLVYIADAISDHYRKYSQESCVTSICSQTCYHMK